MASSGIAVNLIKDSKLTSSHEVLPHCGQDYLSLKQQCLLRKELFSDPEFKACPASIGYHELAPTTRTMHRLVWMRPKDFCKPRVPKFIHGGMSRFDICQGKYLSNCWFLAAAACLTLHPRLLQKIVPPDQGFEDENYAGIFHFQFYRFGQWIDVVVDDLLPVVDGELFFAYSSDRDEFWMPLLEKAYAKLNGTYEDLAWGSLTEAFVDFTGGVGQKFYLKIPNQQSYEEISTGLATSSVMGSGLKAFGIFKKEKVTPEGLIRSHVYSITGVHMLDLGDKTVKLLRLRNPWGKVEWNGRWSDNSELWFDVDPGLQKKLLLKKEDGEFWMQLDDYEKNFDILEICHLTTEAPEGEKHFLNSSSFQGSWIEGLTAGGERGYSTYWMNPQFWVLLLEPDGEKSEKQPKGKVFISLLQKVGRTSGKFLLVSIDIFQVSKEDLQGRTPARMKELLSKLKAVGHIHGQRRDTTGVFHLAPGYYLIIPSTQLPLKEGNFILRIFTESKHLSAEMENEISADEKTLKTIIDPDVDADKNFHEAFLHFTRQDRKMSTAEFQDALNHTTQIASPLKTKFTLELCQKMVQHFSESGKDHLTQQESKHFCFKLQQWESIFLQFDEDKSGTMNTNEIQLALDAAGFHLNTQTLKVLLGKYGDPSLQIHFDNFVSLMIHLESVFRQCKHLDVKEDGLIYMYEKEWMELATSP